MKNKLIYTFDDHLKEQLKNPAFSQAWEESEPEYILAKQLIEKRLKRKISQRNLAKKLHTSQAAVSRIETMNANPSLSFLKKLARALDSQLILQFK